MDDNDNILDIDSWFDHDTQSSMIFTFIFCIIALVAFVFQIFLCFKHEKLWRFMSFYVASPTTVATSLDNTTCHRGDIFLYILSAICPLLLLYVVIISFIKFHRHFRRYHATKQFFCAHGHDKGPSTAVALELSTLSEIIHVHIAHLYLPITLLSVHEIDHTQYYMVSGN